MGGEKRRLGPGHGGTRVRLRDRRDTRRVPGHSRRKVAAAGYSVCRHPWASLGVLVECHCVVKAQAALSSSL
mgnify:CR=1 FL=1